MSKRDELQRQGPGTSVMRDLVAEPLVNALKELGLQVEMLQPTSGNPLDLDRVLLDDKGRLRVLPAAVYEQIDWMTLRLWCHHRAYYSLPTSETVERLRAIIGDRDAIEVGAGNGVYGRALGIPMTDSWCQTLPDVALMYMMSRQPTIKYPADVERLDAVAAVRKYNPKVVVGAWVTHWIDPNLPPPPGGGNMYGLREDLILDHPSVETYIVVGNLTTHAHKPLRSRPHQIIRQPWVWSRASKPDDDCIFVWDKN
jgi:hypothetical protein